jgi:hypothetical protein
VEHVPCADEFSFLDLFIGGRGGARLSLFPMEANYLHIAARWDGFSSFHATIESRDDSPHKSLITSSCMSLLKLLHANSITPVLHCDPSSAIDNKTQKEKRKNFGCKY